MIAPNRRIEIHEGPDSHGRYFYTLFWMADYHPGHPLGEHRIAERAQCFFDNPSRHGVLASRVTVRRNLRRATA